MTAQHYIRLPKFIYAIYTIRLPQVVFYLSKCGAHFISSLPFVWLSWTHPFSFLIQANTDIYVCKLFRQPWYFMHPPSPVRNSRPAKSQTQAAGFLEMGDSERRVTVASLQLVKQWAPTSWTMDFLLVERSQRWKQIFLVLLERNKTRVEGE
jgi:hypothetical protein